MLGYSLLVVSFGAVVAKQQKRPSFAYDSKICERHEIRPNKMLVECQGSMLEALTSLLVTLWYRALKMLLVLKDTPKQLICENCLDLH